MGWVGAWATCGISETHVLPHVYNEIPNYNAVFRECKFVKDTGDVVFYKNAHGRAKVRAVFRDGEGAGSASDSGVA
ncbi:hypothetical protein B0H13DRAFT_2108003 [Mycena leptocephala]|nr:hypothetical protein B0H13DRAFT_2108003 [Mycena leptocephala]